ncbi:MAG: hypothetical protein R3310_15465, partial [Candidatus Competibacteraceae bacterium]|nr:hypothetical protein [Candidatus Competibacteraceae bacterium]
GLDSFGRKKRRQRRLNAEDQTKEALSRPQPWWPAGGLMRNMCQSIGYIFYFKFSQLILLSFRLRLGEGFPAPGWTRI